MTTRARIRICDRAVCARGLRATGLLAASALFLVAMGIGQPVAADARPDSEMDRGLKAEVDAYTAADRLSASAPCQVVFVGSSSIVRWKPTLSADMAPIPALNRGFGGSQIEHATRWFDELVAVHRPRSIVFYAGDNDIDAGKTTERIVADFDAFMARKTRILGDTPVYFISVKPSKARFAQLDRQALFNDAVRTRAGRRSDLHYINVVDIMMEHGHPKEVFESDGLHMTRRGYEIWTQVVKAALLPNARSEELACHRRDRRDDKG